VIIRQGTIQDLDTLVDFNAAMAFETEGLILDRERLRCGVKAVLSDPSRGFYWVAEVEGRVVGQMMITFEWSDWRNGTFWWIQSVYVSPEHRRRGVFRALYEHVEKQARDLPGVCGLRLYVEGGNAKAQRTYASLGMQRTSYQIFEKDFVLVRSAH
jgi:Acetyltransferases